MKLADWSSLAQAVGVVAALIGLIHQSRFTAKSMRAVAYQNLVEQIHSLHERMLQIPDSSLRQFLGILGSKTSTDPKEILLALSLFNLLENAYFQFKEGNIPKALWSGWEKQIPSYFQSPAVYHLWTRNRDSYNPAFRKLMDRNWASAAKPVVQIDPPKSGAVSESAG